MIKLTCSETFTELSKVQENAVENPVFKVASIVLVGALLDSNNNLSDIDKGFLVSSITDFIKLGVSFPSEKLSVNIANTEYEKEEGDFIKTAPHADMVVFCRVNKSGILGAVPGYTESPLLRLGQNWHDAIKQSNPTLISISGDPLTTVNADDIPYEIYRRVLRIGSSYEHYAKRDSDIRKPVGP